MMKNNFIYNKYFSLNIKKIVFFVFITSVYTGYKIGGAKLSKISVLEFMTEMITDYYLVVFIIFPILGMCIFSTFFPNMAVEVIRYKSFRAYFFVSIIPLIILSFLLVLIPSVFSFLYSFILDFPATIQPTSYFDDIGIARICLNSEYSVLFTFLCAALYLFVGMNFIAITICFLYYVFSKRKLLFVIGAAYILTVFGVQWSVDKFFPYIFLNNYTIIYDALYNNCLFVQILIILIVFIFIAIATKKRWGCSDL